MSIRQQSLPYICTRCLRALARPDRRHAVPRRHLTSSPHHRSTAQDGQQDSQSQKDQEAEAGAMSRRLAEMSEQNLEDGGRSAQKAIEEAGFDEELKEKLLNRIADASFQNENRRAFAQAGLKTSAGKGTKYIAAAEPWSGTESVADASLRMLDDSRKKLRRPSSIPGPAARPPKKVDTGRPKKGPSSGVRLANARDRSSMYSFMRDDSLSDEEKEQMRKELKEKFTPGARPLPQTLQGLASLANERIEDAIARGQFKNLPRGQKIERDYNMSSPFLDTTEYFMNKIIQRQEIVPPWIEKQQELVADASKFRSRIRNDWRRHAARTIASRGGSLQSQIARAEEYARAEAIVNPTQKKEEKLNTVDTEGHISQISLSGKLQAPKQADDQLEVKIEVKEQPLEDTARPHMVSNDVQAQDVAQQAPHSLPSDDQRVFEGAVFPFREPHWEATERSYHKAAIDSLNALTRSYNLMAPNLAKKPYFLLDRELRACYADVAPQLADEIRERASKPKMKIEASQAVTGGVLEQLGGGSARVYDERRPQYGFKELWRDIFGKKQTA